MLLQSWFVTPNIYFSSVVIIISVMLCCVSLMREDLWKKAFKGSFCSEIRGHTICYKKPTWGESVGWWEGNIEKSPCVTPTLQFFHQYLFLSLAALLSNCEAPACRASARSSSSDSFWSLSRTLSTFTRMMSTTWGTKTPIRVSATDTFSICSKWAAVLTSSTCACVCWSRLLLVRFGAWDGGPPSPSGAPGAPGVPAASGVDLQGKCEFGNRNSVRNDWFIPAVEYS